MTMVNSNKASFIARHNLIGLLKCFCSTISLFIVLMHAAGCLSELTATDVQVILDQHSTVRSTLTVEASNMALMLWDNGLATLAQNRASQCNRVTLDNKIPTYGINIATYIGDYNYSIADMITNTWATQKQRYVLATGCTASWTCAEYMQMIWATARGIGCGLEFCPSGQPYYEPSVQLVCLYSATGNFATDKPYTAGVSCSACPADIATCVTKQCAVSASPPKVVPVTRPPTVDISLTVGRMLLLNGNIVLNNNPIAYDTAYEYPGSLQFKTLSFEVCNNLRNCINKGSNLLLQYRGMACTMVYYSSADVLGTFAVWLTFPTLANETDVQATTTLQAHVLAGCATVGVTGKPQINAATLKSPYVTTCDNRHCGRFSRCEIRNNLASCACLTLTEPQKGYELNQEHCTLNSRAVAIIICCVIAFVLLCIGFIACIIINTGNMSKITMADKFGDAYTMDHVSRDRTNNHVRLYVS